MIIRILLLAFAVVVFALLAFDVITTEFFRWEAGAFAAGFASFLPWPNLPKENQ